jgi:hypothetical protein
MQSRLRRPPALNLIGVRLLSKPKTHESDQPLSPNHAMPTSPLCLSDQECVNKIVTQVCSLAYAQKAHVAAAAATAASQRHHSTVPVLPRNIPDPQPTVTMKQVAAKTHDQQPLPKPQLPHQPEQQVIMDVVLPRLLSPHHARAERRTTSRRKRSFVLDAASWQTWTTSAFLPPLAPISASKTQQHGTISTSSSSSSSRHTR